jgi:16S rRNA (uracil1498-N3)-methyltransferase
VTLRLHVPAEAAVSTGLAVGAEFALPEGAARHAQVRRVQPGDVLTLFDGTGTEARAEVLSMGRRDVQVRVLDAVDARGRELPLAVTLAFGMPANERMDALVEKATELGVAVLQPLVTARSVLRLDGDRAERRRAHWQAVAVAACEQSGRIVVPEVRPVAALAAWLAAERASASTSPAVVRRWLLSTEAGAPPFVAEAVAGAAAGGVAGAAAASGPRVVVLSGPEGGLDVGECEAARAAGFAPVSLGPRVLRADTAPLAVLAALALSTALSTAPSYPPLSPTLSPT